MKNIIKWIKKEAWLIYMLIGTALLTWSMVEEVFFWQIPVGCMFVVMGVGIESTKN